MTDQFTSTNSRGWLPRKGERNKHRMAKSLEAENLMMSKYLSKNWKSCVHSLLKKLTDVKTNLMFGTKLAFADHATDLYLRPETAQGIFVNFKRTKIGTYENPFWDCSTERPFETKL